ncbi:hypothetical protein [Robbsia andropogonis]|uniref:hypothetical protein n=1 Tax=Robbsia andropogonis TaxID=28092 RepID=UPI002A6B20AF|nr:hypothetical protein [Robbsia andropogonis]
MRALLEHWLGNVLSLLVCVCLVTTAMLVPAEEARAATGTFLPVWRTTYVDGYTPITWPDENWTDIATATYTGGAKSATLTVNPSEQWILNDDQNAGILGLDSFQAGNFVQYNSNRPPIIFARYFAEQAQLRVTVIRVRRMGNTVHVQKADWTPWDGLLYARDRYFLSSAEKSNVFLAGHDPFANFSNGDKTDPVFYNISFQAAQVAVGQAMQHYQASIAFMAVPSIRLDQQTSTSGGFLRKTITTTTKGYAKPIWYVGLPPTAQPYGSIAQICAITYGNGSSCDDTGHVVSSGVAFSNWQGGTMPATEDLLFTDTETKHSWSVIAFALLTIALVAVGGAALAAGLAAAAGGAVAGVAGAGLTISAEGVALTAAAAGALYTGASALVNGGSLVSAQNGYLGSTGSGTATSTATNSTYEAQLRSATTSKVITDDVDSSLSGITSQYQGACGETGTYSGCMAAGADAGMVPRTDDPENGNQVASHAGRYDMCKASGYTLSNLERCASGALLTPAEVAAYQNGGNVVTNQSSLPPSNGGTSAATLYYNGVTPSQ